MILENTHSYTQKYFLAETAPSIMKRSRLPSHLFVRKRSVIVKKKFLVVKKKIIFVKKKNKQPDQCKWISKKKIKVSLRESVFSNS